jgi:hypothetical protein
MPRHRPLLAALIVPLVATACGGSTEQPPVRVSSESAERPIGPGDVRITSTDGALVLSVIGDSVWMQLSDSLRQSVREEVRKEAGDSGTLGATIANAVGAAVSAAMGVAVRVPASAVENLRYENGELRFDVKGAKVRFNDKRSHSGDSGNGGAFSEEDARRFIDAVRNAQSRTVAM